MGNQEALHRVASVPAPPMLLEIGFEFTGADLVEQAGQGVSKACSVTSYLRAYDHEEHHYQSEQECVDDGDGPGAALQHFLQMRHERTHQIGEEDGEEKSDKRVTGDVKKTQPQREQKHCDQDPSRT